MTEWLFGLYLFFHDAILYVLHFDVHLRDIVAVYGPWVYLFLFLIVFAETGFVVTPFLPGDSLLFASGAVAISSGLNLYLVIVLLFLAAVLGDMVNYWIGHFIGPRIFSQKKSFFFNPDHLEKTHAFYEKYGGKTIIIARFVPIVRTCAPFVAGIGSMTYSRFFSFNVVGALLWVLSLTGAGYFFGNIPIVQRHFSVVILGIIVVSCLPGLYEIWAERKRSRAVNDAIPKKSVKELTEDLSDLVKL